MCKQRGAGTANSRDVTEESARLWSTGALIFLPSTDLSFFLDGLRLLRISLFADAALIKRHPEHSRNLAGYISDAREAKTGRAPGPTQAKHAKS
jgi:hypothetical protein